MLNGGAGSDTAAYAAAAAGVVVSLAVNGAQNTGGAGIDTLIGIENLTGSAFADTLSGDSNDNMISGGAGNDTIAGGAGNDVLDGGAGDDSLDGGAGADTASYTAAAAAVAVSLAIAGPQDTGGAGTDTLVAIENLTGSAFDDTLTGDANANTLSGGGGNDQLFGGDGNDTLDGGNGNDVLDGGNGADTMAGGAGNDTYFADPSDMITENAGEGTDTIIVTSSYDYTLGANIENLTLIGYTGNGRGNELANTIQGNDGNNLLFGNGGNDVLLGGNGNDELLGGAGTDEMYGGTGDDIYEVDSASDSVIEYAGEGNDTVYAAVSYTLPQNVENFSVLDANVVGTGNALDNVMTSNNVVGVVLRGMGGNDQLIGYANDDWLDGGDGNDWISGDYGNDTLIGGAGSDRMTGGRSNDTFLFAEGDFGGTSTSTADEITDFTSGQDKIDLTQVDASTLLAGDQAFTFVGTAAFSGAAGELRYEQISGNTYVSGDVNGDGSADFMIRLDGLHTLTSSDFGL